MTLTEFARIVDCSKCYMSMVKTKTQKPGRKFARQIERATDGAVKADYLLNGIEYKNEKLSNITG